MASTIHRPLARQDYSHNEFCRIADDFHNTLRRLGFDDKPELASRFALDLKAEEAAILVSALTPPLRAANSPFQIHIVKVRGKGRGGMVLGEWLFEAHTFDCVDEITVQAMYRVLTEIGGLASTLCPICGGNGYIKTIWRPGDPSLDGDFKWCDACDRTGERRQP